MSDRPTPPGGTCSARFDSVRELFAAKLDSCVPEGRVCFGTGAGGSMVIADADRRLTIAYVMNKMVMSGIVEPIAAALVERIYDVVSGTGP